MSIKIWQQCGHNSNWNLDSFREDSAGDGLILSPVHCDRSQIERIAAEIKEQSLFDPQFYLPSSQKRKLQSYEFFPDVMVDGFDTNEFSVVALDAARKCVDFQLSQGFQSIIVPARYFDEMVTNYIEQQKGYTVTPFLKALGERENDKDVVVTLPLTSAMVKDKTYRTNLLNWITSYPEIKGVYLLVSHVEPGSKQIADSNYLVAYLDFVKALREADLRVILGYQNTEGVLFSLVDGCEHSMGSFENTRMFSLDKFIENDEERRGPRARIYVPSLFQWIQWNHAIEIRDEKPELWSEIYSPTEYGDRSLSQPREPKFNQPDLYKHHFIAFSQQLGELSDLPAPERYESIRLRLKRAIELNHEIESARIDLDRYGKGEHLQLWLDAVNKYARQHF